MRLDNLKAIYCRCYVFNPGRSIYTYQTRDNDLDLSHAACFSFRISDSGLTDGELDMLFTLSRGTDPNYVAGDGLMTCYVVVPASQC